MKELSEGQKIFVLDMEKDIQFLRQRMTHLHEEYETLSSRLEENKKKQFEIEEKIKFRQETINRITGE